MSPIKALKDSRLVSVHGGKQMLVICILNG
jgi:hypothetical protein